MKQIKMGKKQDLIITYFAIILAVIFLTEGAFYTYKQIYPNPTPTITFNVTGVVNATNSSIISIQFECIKYCIDHTNTNWYQDCWKECSSLGK